MTETTAIPARQGAASPTLLDRLLGVVPIASIVVWLALVYMVESTGRTTPTLFSDEVKWTHLSRGIEATGRAMQRGEPASFGSLYSYLIAPAWALKDTAHAYDVAKYLTVIAMTLAAVPAYLLARRLVSKPAALFVAAASISIPSMTYGLYLIPEGVAYPWATLCALLIVGALATRSRRWIAAAVVASALAPLVRGQLAVVPAAFALAALGLWWTGPRGKRLRARWSLLDYVGVVLLAVGVFLVLNRWLLHRSQSWAIVSEFYRGWMWKHFHWALGALTIGLGVLPLVGTVCALFPGRGERRSPWERSFVAVLLSYVFMFGMYTAVKAAYLEYSFATRVTERNLFYVAPLLFLATAVALERRRVRLLPLAAGVGIAAGLIATTPQQLDNPYFEALGFSILTMANRHFYWGTGALETALWVALAVSAAILLAARRRLPRPAAVGGFAAVAVALVAWNLAGQITAARGTADDADLMLAGFPLKPPSWVDKQTGGAHVTYLGQSLGNDIRGIDLLELWNRSIVNVWSLDGTAPGPGPTLSPNLDSTDGTLGNPPGTPYLLADSGVDPVGKPVASVPGSGLRLYRLNGPIRLLDWIDGIGGDGWVVSDSSYSRFADAGGPAGTALITLSRTRFCPDPARGAPEGRVTVTVGRLAINDNAQPTMGAVESRRQVTLPNCQERVVRIPVASGPWRAEVHVEGTFQPSQYTASSDARELGAVVTYGFQPR